MIESSWSRLRAVKPSHASYVLANLDALQVDLVDHYAQTGTKAAGTLFRIGPELAEDQTRGAAAIWTGVATKNDWDVDLVNGPAGARLLLSGLYMEDSKHYFRARGAGAEGQITILGGKLAPIVPINNPSSASELADATATVSLEDFQGTFALLQSTFFIQTVAEASHCCPSDVAADYGPRIRVRGSAPVEVQAVGLKLRRQKGQTPDRPEYDLSEAERASYVRLGSKRAIPVAEPLPDVVVATEGDAHLTIPLPDGMPTAKSRAAALAEADQARLLRALELLRTLEMPAYYDESGLERDYTLNMDNLFFMDPSSVGLVILGGPVECVVDVDCATDGPETGDTDTVSCLLGVCVPDDDDE